MPKEEKAPVVPQGEPGAEEIGKRKSAMFARAIERVRQQEREEYEAELVEILDEVTKTDKRERPGNFLEVPDNARIRLSSPTDPLYRHMSEAEREWRNPDADHWYAEWIRGQFVKDRGQMLQASVELAAMFPQRATTTEGTPGADGAISTGTGGALIPRPLENVIMIARDRVAKMRRFAQILTMTRQTHTVPTAGAMTAYMVGESTTAAQGEGTIAEVQLSAHKGQVKAVATVEVLSDAAINLVNLYAKRAGGAIGELEDNQFFSDGDGSAPNISACIAGTAYAETSSAELKFTDVVAMYFNVGQVYRANGIWLAAGNVLQYLSNVRDGHGKPFYLGLDEKPGAVTDDPQQEGTLMRRPVYEVPFPDGTIMFGDANAGYMVGARQGIVSSASEHIKFEEDQVMWKFTVRFDGQNVDTVALQEATGITSATSL